MNEGNLADSHGFNTSNASCLAWLPVFPTVSGWPHFLCMELAVPLHLCLAMRLGNVKLYSIHGIEWAAHVCQLQGRSFNLLECIGCFNWLCFFWCPQTSLNPQWRTWGYFLHCLAVLCKLAPCVFECMWELMRGAVLYWHRLWCSQYTEPAVSKRPTPSQKWHALWPLSGISLGQQALVEMD